MEFSFEEAEALHGRDAYCIKCGAEITFEADVGGWWVPFEYGNPPPFTYDCPKGFEHDGGA